MYCPFVCSHPILYIYFCRIYRISFLYAIQYTQIDIPISPIRLDFRLRFTICGVRARNTKISDCIDRHIKKISTKKKNRSRSSLSSLQIRNASYGFILATCKRGLSKLWCSHHPIDYASRRSFERILATGLDAIFGETSTGDKAESTQLPEKHNTWEIFAKKLRARSNSFRRHRFRTTSKVSIPKDRSPIPLTLSSCFSRSIVETTEFLSYFG